MGRWAAHASPQYFPRLPKACWPPWGRTVSAVGLFCRTAIMRTPSPIIDSCSEFCPSAEEDGSWEGEAAVSEFTQCLSPGPSWALAQESALTKQGRGKNTGTGTTSATTSTALPSSLSPWNWTATSPLKLWLRIKFTYGLWATTTASTLTWGPGSRWVLDVLDVLSQALSSGCWESSSSAEQPTRDTPHPARVLPGAGHRFQVEKSSFHSKANFLPVWILMKFHFGEAFR